MIAIAVQRARQVFPVVFGLLLFGVGLYALYNVLRPVDFDDVMAHLRAMPASVLAQALGATVIGYASLMFYDWFGLRYIGKSVPLGVIGLGSFLGYAFGNTIGVSIVSGGAVRYRIYSAVGLSAFEVAAVSSYVAMVLGTGLTLFGLGALILRPDAVTAYLPVTAASVQMLATAAIVVSLTVIVALSVSQFTVRIRGVDVRLPPIGDLAGQLVVTFVDIVAAAYVLWILLPAGKPEFASFVAEFSAATMIGVMSHVPGGIGVFETVIIGTLPTTVPVADAAAALLMYRLIYFLFPFTIGFLIVALNEIRAISGFGGRVLARMSTPVQSAVVTLHGLAPGLVAVVAFGLGAYLLVLAMLPAVHPDPLLGHDLIAAVLREGGTLISALAGGALLILSHGLIRRRSSAFWLTIVALCAAAVAATVNGVDLKHALVPGGAALALLPFRTAFDRPGRLTQDVFGIRWFTMVFAVGLAAVAVFFFVHKSVPYSPTLWTEFAAQSDTPRALRAGLLATSLLFFFCLHVAVRPARLRRAPAACADTLASAAEILGHVTSPQGWLSQTGDKQILYSESGRTFLMYAVQGRSWIALGDPVGDPSDFQALCWRFSQIATQAGGRPVFYEVSADTLSLWLELGLTLNKIGEEAVIKLPEFSLSGQRFKTMRAAQNKRLREGYTLELLQPPHDTLLIDELRQISDAWLSSKTGREKGFSVGRFDPAYLNNFDLGLVRRDGRIIAFCNIMSTGCQRYAAVDLMRYLPDEASGIMEFMFLRLIEHYKAAGFEEFSLGTAPLSGLSERSVPRSWNRYGRLIYRHGGAFYNFEGLRAFKQKFQPEWRPRYLAVPPNVSALRAMGDAALLIAGPPRGLVGKITRAA